MDFRVRSLEHQVAYLLSQNEDAEIPDLLIPEVETALDEGRKVAAMKSYRELTGCGLDEAKDYVERRSFRRII